MTDDQRHKRPDPSPAGTPRVAAGSPGYHPGRTPNQPAPTDGPTARRGVHANPAAQNRDGRTVQPGWQVDQQVDPVNGSEVKPSAHPASSPHPPFYFAPHPPVPAPAPERQPQHRTDPRSQKLNHQRPAHAEPNSSQHPRQSRPPLTTSHHRHPPPSPSPPRTESNPARYHPPAHACPPATPGTDPPPAIPP